MSITRYRLLLLAAAFLFSTGGVAIKACSLTSWQIACFRSGIAAVCVAVLLPEARRILSPRILPLGITYAATLVFFVLANKLTTGAQAIFLQSTAPVYLLLLAPLVLRERIRPSEFVMVGLVVAGAVLLLFGGQHAAATAPDPARGNWLGLLSGVAWALTLTGFRWLAKRGKNADSPAAVVVAGNIIAFAVCLPMALPVASSRPMNLAVILYLGVFQIGLSYIAVTKSVLHVPAVEAAALLMLEPVLNPIWTWLLYAERLSVATLIGGAMIVCATFGSTFYQARQRLVTA